MLDKVPDFGFGIIGSIAVIAVVVILAILIFQTVSSIVHIVLTFLVFVCIVLVIYSVYRFFIMDNESFEKDIGGQITDTVTGAFNESINYVKEKVEAGKSP